ncbi:MAG: VapC toxin family domain ribonuclease [Glaciihabitans sp.]|nr:VapC toxin family domain ribonuclease [Glaciihabitans sp.]
MVMGELALGQLKDRDIFLRSLAGLASIVAASHGEVMHLVESKQLHRRGLSLVDAHLVASLFLNPGTSLWTRDKRLKQAAVDLSLNNLDEAQPLL